MKVAQVLSSIARVAKTATTTGAVGVIALLVLGCKALPAGKPLPPEHDAPTKDEPSKTVVDADKPVVLPASPTGLATSILVTVSGGDVSTYEIVDNRLRNTGTVTLVKVDDDPELRFVHHVGFGDWADHDHLFLTIGDRSLVQITPAAITRVAIPAPERFKAPKPASTQNEELVEGGPDVVGNDLVLSRGAAWWSQCAWGFPADGFQCHLHMTAQLWPTPSEPRAGDRPVAGEFDWPRAAPPGFVTRTIKNNSVETGVVCESPRNAGPKQNMFANTADSEELDSVHWVSVDPPRLLVIYGHGGYSSLIQDRWTLHAACNPKPIASGTVAAPGPAGLWVEREGVGADEKQVIYRGAAPLGEVPSKVTVLFRPTK